jgi:chaperonin GroEL (HSP60 family)
MIGQNTKRDSGRKVQLENIRAAKAIADVIRTCLGPRAMLKVCLIITNSYYLLAINIHSLYGYQ